MKLEIKKILIAFITIAVIFPLTVSAQTLKQFEDEVAKYTAELQEKKNKIAKNNQEVEEIKKKITEIEEKIKTTETEISNLEKEIDECNQKIEKKKEESKKIMKYFQIVNGENSYLEYIFDASSMTDMIYRLSVVEQLTEYNQQVVKELNELINENNKKKSELETKKKELSSLEKSLEEEKAKIDADTASIKETMPSVEQQIKSAEEQVKFMKSIGCGANEEKNACVSRYYASLTPKTSSRSSSSGSAGSAAASTPSSNGFYRPIEYGYMTQPYKGTAHMGVDVSSSNKSITVYPIATGVVSAKYYDSAGALVLKIRHNYNGQILYSTYAHLRSWYVSIGNTVSPDTPLGQMGSTGNSTGPHLHLEITTCDWKSAGGGCTWSQYIKSTLNPSSYVQFPSSWSNR